MLKLDVVCALILWKPLDKQPLILLAKKPLGTSNAGLYEFPGGKIEANESPEQALIREIKEELQCNLRHLQALTPSETHMDDKIIRLIPFICELTIDSSLPIPLEHESLGFFTIHTAATLPLAIPDIPIWHEFLSILKK